MSQVLIFFIRAYQALISPLIHTAVGVTAGCRYSISCSSYAIDALRKNGVIRGGRMSIERILTCHP